MAYLWDSWYRKSRRVMQRAFSYESRKHVTEEVPELKMGNAMAAPTPYDAQPQFALIPGLPVVSQFRYPLWQAKPIQPPEGVNLAGSSSEFVSVAPGNVLYPVGQPETGAVSGGSPDRQVPRDDHGLRLQHRGREQDRWR